MRGFPFRVGGDLQPVVVIFLHARCVAVQATMWQSSSINKLKTQNFRRSELSALRLLHRF